MILAAILTFVLMIPVTSITEDGTVQTIALIWLLMAAGLSVLILVILFVTSLFDAAEKRSRRPPLE